MSSPRPVEPIAGGFDRSALPQPGDDVAVSVVVPCYRDEAGLEQLFARLGPVLATIEGGAELVIVDDGSPDRTVERACALATGFPFPVRVVELLRNFGQHPAVIAGFEHSRGRVVVTMDSDLQYPPEQIPVLLAGLSDEHPVVSGVRQDRRDPLLRRLITRVTGRWLGRRTGVRLEDYGSMFRAYDRRVVRLLVQLRERRPFIPASVAWLGVPIREVPVEHEERPDGRSRYRFGDLAEMFMDLVTGYSISPLRVLAMLAFVGSLIAFVGTTTFAVYRFIEGAGVSGTVSAFATVFFLLGVQLLVLALMSEYLGRVYNDTRARPNYIVEQVREYEPGSTDRR